MALDVKQYDDIPGHDGLRPPSASRKGYRLNQFCMSLMKAENRDRFRANERAYLDEWQMTEAAEAGGAGPRSTTPRSR